jgi:hypothetical protein
MVRNQANAVKCSNNLHQIAMAMEVYRQNHEDTFPGHLSELLGEGFSAKSFLCPFDVQKGADPDMGRRPYDNVEKWGNYQRLHEPSCSYCYECSGKIDANLFTDSTTQNPGNGIWSDVDYFYRDMATGRPVAGTVSWADGKQHQLKFGNLKDPTKGTLNSPDPARWGESFSSDQVPIVRCYWHAGWRTLSHVQSQTNRKVNNISLGFNTFWSTPYWEKDVTPNIDPPN